MAVAQGDPNRQIRGLQAGAGLFARLSVTLVHQKSYLASGEHAPLRYSLAQEGKNRGREGEKKKEEKKKETYVCVFIPDVQHTVVKMRGSATGQREDYHAYRALLRTTAQHRTSWIFQIDFHSGKYYLSDRISIFR